MDQQNQITLVLRRLRAGEAQAATDLAPLVYHELKRIAKAQLRDERHVESVQPTALVNEAYLRLMMGQSADWKDRAHFYAVAAVTVRHILVDRARSRRAQKHGGALHRVEFNDVFTYAEERGDELLELNEALNRLASVAPRASQVVERRFFGGMTDEEIGESLGISSRTVKRDWRIARAWLRGELQP